MAINDKDVQKAKQIFASLSFSKKLEYIWGYYKVHFLVGVTVVALICYTLNILVFNPQKKIGMQLSFVNSSLSEEASESLSSQLQDLLIDDTQKYKFEISNYIISDEGTPYAAAERKAFVVSLMSNEFDLIISNKTEFDSNVSSDIVLKISDIPNLDTSSYSLSPDGYGILIDDFKKLNELNFESSGMYIYAVKNSRNLDKLSTLIKFLN